MRREGLERLRAGQEVRAFQGEEHHSAGSKLSRVKNITEQDPVSPLCGSQRKKEQFNPGRTRRKFK